MSLQGIVSATFSQTVVYVSITVHVHMMSYCCLCILFVYRTELYFHRNIFIKFTNPVSKNSCRGIYEVVPSRDKACEYPPPLCDSMWLLVKYPLPLGASRILWMAPKVTGKSIPVMCVLFQSIDNSVKIHTSCWENRKYSLPLPQASMTQSSEQASFTSGILGSILTADT